MTTRCPHCRARITRPPGLLARVSVAGSAWLVVGAMAFGFGLLGPLGIAVIPFVVFSSIALVSAAHQFTHGDRICETCGRIYEMDGEWIAPESARAPTQVREPQPWTGHSGGLRA